MDIKDRYLICDIISTLHITLSVGSVSKISAYAQIVRQMSGTIGQPVRYYAYNDPGKRF